MNGLQWKILLKMNFLGVPLGVDTVLIPTRWETKELYIYTYTLIYIYIYINLVEDQQLEFVNPRFHINSNCRVWDPKQFYKYNS